MLHALQGIFPESFPLSLARVHPQKPCKPPSLFNLFGALSSEALMLAVYQLIKRKLCSFISFCLFQHSLNYLFILFVLSLHVTGHCYILLSWSICLWKKHYTFLVSILSLWLPFLASASSFLSFIRFLHFLGFSGFGFTISILPWYTLSIFIGQNISVN